MHRLLGVGAGYVTGSLAQGKMLGICYGVGVALQLPSTSSFFGLWGDRVGISDGPGLGLRGKEGNGCSMRWMLDGIMDGMNWRRVGSIGGGNGRCNGWKILFFLSTYLPTHANSGIRIGLRDWGLGCFSFSFFFFLFDLCSLWIWEGGEGFGIFLISITLLLLVASCYDLV